MSKIHHSHGSALATSLAELPHLPRAQLVELWVKHVGRPPPKAASTPLLLRAVAYALQEQQFGGLKRQDLRLLHKAADRGNVRGDMALEETGGKANQTLLTNKRSGNAQDERTDLAQRDKLRVKAQPIALRPGTRLVREWQGRSHSVEVRADGFGWNSEVYRSLSAVAFAITGARWSGNRFFRL